MPELPCVIYGASGHAKVIADIILAGPTKLLAFIDDNPALDGSIAFDVTIRSFSWLVDRHASSPVTVVLGIGDNYARRAVADRCKEAGMTLQTVIHPSAIISRFATVSAGVTILAQAVVNTNANVGQGALVNTGAIVEHDVCVGDFAHVSPRAVLAGGSRLGELSHLGAGAVVIDDVVVGAGTIIGAGAVVTRHVGDHVVAYGVPARAKRSVAR